MKIESGVTRPKIQRKDPRCIEIETALSKMKVDDSFTVPNHQERGRTLMAAMRMGIKVSSRKLDGAGFRIWRLK